MKPSALLIAFVLASAPAAAETFHGVEMLPGPPDLSAGANLKDDGWDVGTKVGTVLAAAENCPAGLVSSELRQTAVEARDAYASDWMFQQAFKMAWVSTEVAARQQGESACVDALQKLEQ